MHQPTNSYVSTSYLFTGVSTGESDLIHPKWGTNVTVEGKSYSMLATSTTNYDNRFACTATENVWRYRDIDDTYAGLWCQNGEGGLAIIGLQKNDEVTFNVCRGGLIKFDNPEQVGGIRLVAVGESTVKMSATGNLSMTASNGTYIRSITIKSTGLTNLGAIEKNRIQPREDGIYTLTGQRITNPQRGIYIQNGKKIIIR